MKARIIGSILGNVFSILGVTLSAEQIDTAESIVSIICMVLGITITIVSAIIIPLVKWYKQAKQDGKIDENEVDELVDIISDGVDEIKEQLPQKGEEKDGKN